MGERLTEIERIELEQTIKALKKQGNLRINTIDLLSNLEQYLQTRKNLRV